MGPSERPPIRMHLFFLELHALSMSSVFSDVGGGGRDSKAMSDGLLLY